MGLWIIWLILIVLLGLIELLTISLVTIWFVISGVLALIISFFIKNYIVQFAVFLIVGVILLITIKPILIKFIKDRKEKARIKKLIGSTAIVTKRITKKGNGLVKIDDKEWNACADKVIKKGEKVKILEINEEIVKVEKEK